MNDLFVIERCDEMCVVGECVSEQKFLYCCHPKEAVVLCLKDVTSSLPLKVSVWLWPLAKNRGTRLHRRKGRHHNIKSGWRQIYAERKAVTRS